MIFLNTFARCLLTCFVLCSGTARSSDTNDTTPASAKHLQTTSLLTCMDNSQLTASFFDVKFYPDNNTVIFDIDATTTLNGNVTVKAELLTYGLNDIKINGTCMYGCVNMIIISDERRSTLHPLKMFTCDCSISPDVEMTPPPPSKGTHLLTCRGK